MMTPWPFIGSARGAKTPASPVQFLWLVIGRRGGKSSVMAILAVYLAIFRDWRPYLRQGERAIVLLVAQDRDQAKIIFRYVQGVLAAPLLDGKVWNVAGDTIELKNQVAIEVVTRNFRSIRGRSVCCALLDEVSMWRSEDCSNPDVQVFNAIRASMATFGGDGLIVSASSPYSRRGVL
jgi:phage terminase large subunit-like protein